MNGLHVVAFVSLGAFVFDEAAQRLRADVVAALADAGWKHDAAATVMGITPQRLSLQLNGHEPLTFLARATALEGFWPALVKRQSTRYGYELIANLDLQRLLAGLGAIEKRMARMDLASAEQREHA